MQVLIDILKSRGKTGGIGLMILGLVHGVLAYYGTIQGTFMQSAEIFLLGLAVFGIRAKLDSTA